MKRKTIRVLASRLAELEVELETASEEDRRQEIEKTIEGITRQFMVVAKNNLNAIFELDNEVQKMLTK